LPTKRIVTFLHFFFLGLIVIITPTRIGRWANDLAIRLRDMGPAGMAILALMVGASAFPPSLPCVILMFRGSPRFAPSIVRFRRLDDPHRLHIRHVARFPPGGMRIHDGGCDRFPLRQSRLIQAQISVCADGDIKTFFLKWVKKQSKSNDKWDAFGKVMAAKGLPLVIMIRYCPLPWAVGNGLFAVRRTTLYSCLAESS